MRPARACCRSAAAGSGGADTSAGAAGADASVGARVRASVAFLLVLAHVAVELSASSRLEHEL